MYCAKCGVKSSPDAVFCYHCGEQLPGATDSVSPGPQYGDREGAPPVAKRPKVHPANLEADQYAHPLDRRSLESTARFGPVVLVTRAIIKNWDEPMIKGQLLGGTVKVGPAQFGEINELVTECASILNMPSPEVFIKHDPGFNAVTLGVERPLIILHSSLVDEFTPDELTYIIGHEMGHIKSEHSLYLSVAHLLAMGARGLADRLFGLGSLLVVPAMHALQSWMRKAELTADRAGLICVQDLDVARKSLIKLAVGSHSLFKQLDMDEYLRQADVASRDGYGRMSEFFQTHPHIANRVRELKFFHDSPAYAELLGERPDKPQVEVEQMATEAVNRGRNRMAKVGRTVTGFLSAHSSFEKALAEFDRVITRYPATEAARQALYYKGLAHLNLKQGLAAAKAFQSFVLHNPLHELAPEGYWGLGLAAERLLNDPQGAVEHYRQLIDEFPEHPRAEAARESLQRLGEPAPELSQAQEGMF